MEVYSPEEVREVEKSRSFSGAIPYAKIFLWFGLGILLSGLVGCFIAYALPLMVTIDNVDQVSGVLVGLTIASAIVIFPITIVMCFKAYSIKGKILMPTLYVIYALAFGVLLGSVLMMVDAGTAILALVSTGGVMAVMGVLGILVGDKMNKVLMVALALGFSSMIIGLIGAFTFNTPMMWIFSYGMLAYTMLITAYDIYRIKAIVSRAGSIHSNLSVYLAFTIYTDFIVIFIRLLTIFGNRNN